MTTWKRVLRYTRVEHSRYGCVESRIATVFDVGLGNSMISARVASAFLKSDVE